MSADAWITLAVVVATLGVLVAEKAPPAVAIFGATTVLFVLDVVDAGEAFQGFSNPAPLTVAALYVVAGGVEVTGALEWLTRRTLPPPAAAPRGAPVTTAELGRFLPAPLLSSAFLNNTTIVAMMAPRVVSWARQVGRPASVFLIPLSFVSILGGLVTVIGTSTNLVVSGLLTASGQEPIGLFEITRVGLPLAAAGLVVLVAVVPRLLRQRPTPGVGVGERPREFTVEMVVAERGGLVGRSVAEAGLRNLEGVYLVEIERAGHRISPVPPTEVLVGGDRLTFAGNVARILDLQRLPGLAPAEERHFSVVPDGSGRTFYEMVVAPHSSLIGTTLKGTGFRNRYGGAVVAIHRAGERVPSKLGSVPLRAGDVLLVLSDEHLRDRLWDHHDFLVVSRLDGATPPRRQRARLVELTILALLVVVGIGWLDILQASLVAAFALMGMRVISPAEARAAVDLDVIVMIAASFGIGAAIAASGLGATIADGLVAAFDGFGDVGLLVAVLLATIVLTELITNNAAAVMMFPIAMAVASQAGVDPRPFAMAIAVGASASFLTPIGYQTNTMVYGMGGYRFGDFARVGFPLTVVSVAVAVAVIPLAWPF